MFFILPYEMAESWWICFFVYLFTDRCIQSWNADFVSFFLVGYSLWGNKYFRFGSGSGSKSNCATRVGSDDLGYGPGLVFTLKPVQTSNIVIFSKKLAITFLYHRVIRLRKVGRESLNLQQTSYQSVQCCVLNVWMFLNLLVGEDGPWNVDHRRL